MEISEKTDEEIALMVQQGDIQAFGMLVDRYERKIKRYAKKFISSAEDAKDLAQEVFMKAYANIQSFNAERRFSPWIYRIAHNEFVNALKKKTYENIKKTRVHKKNPWVTKYFSESLATIAFIVYCYLGAFIVAEYIFAPILFRVQNYILLVTIFLFFSVYQPP